MSKPPANLGLSRMVAYAPAGDFEGYLTYGIGPYYPGADDTVPGLLSWQEPMGSSNPWFFFYPGDPAYRPFDDPERAWRIGIDCYVAAVR